MTTQRNMRHNPGQLPTDRTGSEGARSDVSRSGERVLVVDDDERLAAIVRDGLTHHGYVVDLAADGPTALTIARDHPPDLVILDLGLPGLDGVEVCRRLGALGGPPVMMLTARDATSEKIAGLDSGADDYMTKPFILEELAARVRALLRRRAGRPEGLLRVADLALDPRGRRVWRGEREVALTTREFDLLEDLLRHAGQVLTHGALLERVWGYDVGDASHAVKVYIGYLRQKLNADGEPDLIHAVRGVGYVLRD